MSLAKFSVGGLALIGKSYSVFVPTVAVCAACLIEINAIVDLQFIVAVSGGRNAGTRIGGADRARNLAID